MRRTLLALAGLWLASLHLPCEAWWNKDWTNRNKVSVSLPAGSLTGAVEQAPLLLRLHSGNFPFLDAKSDGSDVRVIAADDSTPLKFHVEKWDGVNELAFVWVRLPNAGPATPTELYIYSGNPNAVGAEDTRGTWDEAQAGAFHFEDEQSTPVDRSARGLSVSSMTARRINNALIGGGLAFDGNGGLTLAASPALSFSGGFSFSVWIKPSTAQGVLFRQSEGNAPIEIGLEDMRPYVKAGLTRVSASAQLTPGSWKHVGVTLSDRMVLYVDGVEVGAAPNGPAGAAGVAQVAYNFAGELDELLLANQARPADWMKFAALTQAPGSQAVSVTGTETTEGSDNSYFSILLGAVTLDGWVVIAILMVMLVVSFIIMIGKALMLSKVHKANQQFVGALRKSPEDFTALHRALAHNPKHAMAAGVSGSNLYRLYRVSMEELNARVAAAQSKGQKAELTPQALGAIRASLDAGLVKESHRLNSQMVLLTIAISGGPFLGLLGTVVGVMITFAAIAAAGDVNVNSIAPGIAAALVATVAGLAVAIPALFGYNYLSSRIREVNADMQVFADELVTRLAESYS